LKGGLTRIISAKLELPKECRGIGLTACGREDRLDCSHGLGFL
jgi:hypothetical protein